MNYLFNDSSPAGMAKSGRLRILKCVEMSEIEIKIALEKLNLYFSSWKENSKSKFLINTFEVVCT